MVSLWMTAWLIRAPLSRRVMVMTFLSGDGTDGAPLCRGRARPDARAVDCSQPPVEACPVTNRSLAHLVNWHRSRTVIAGVHRSTLSSNRVSGAISLAGKKE